MTVHDRITAEPLPDLAAYVAWAAEHEDMGVAASMELWRTETQAARDAEIRYRAFGAELSDGRGW